MMPYTRADVVAMLRACERSAEYQRRGQRACSHGRASALRDEAIIRLLVDTGMRAGELCGLTMGDMDLANQRAKLMGKGAKERLVRIGRRTGKALWRYLVTRAEATPDEALFIGRDGRPLTTRGLRALVVRLGRRAGLTLQATVHRFRHTFAIVFLQNGGDAYSLQAMLGHSSLDMVKRYLALSQADVENAHRRASPVDNWGI
jgi:site-specific recombinase XerD